MLSFAGTMVSMETEVETAFSNQLLINRVHSFICKNESRQHTLAPFVQACSLAVTEHLNSSLNSELPKMGSPRNNEVKIFATRRRMAYSRTETYVLLEPGQDEKFVSEDELKAKLKDLSENWPGKTCHVTLQDFQPLMRLFLS